MAEVGSAFVSILPSARGFGSKLNAEVGGEVGGAGKSAGSKFGAAFKVGAVAVLGGAAVLGGFLKGAFDEAREAQKVGALTESVIKSTGSAAKVTAQQVGDLAGALSAKTGIDDEVIQSGQNMLLTFKNIRNEAGAGNDIFNQTTATLVDMAAAMGSEPKQAAIQLGKALNDPIKGVAALGRVGVTFTEQQKSTIKSLVESGDVMAAQKIVLKELNSEFGGAAEAQATAGDKARVAWGNFQEAVGTALLPLLDDLLNGFTRVTVFLTDQVGPAFSAVGAFIAPAVASVRGAFESLGTGGGGPLSGLLATFGQIAASVQANLLPALRMLATTFQTTILPAVSSLVAYLAGRLGPVFAQVGNIIATQVIPIVAAVARWLAGTLLPAVAAVAQKVGNNLKPVFDQLVTTFQTKVLPTVQNVLSKLREWGPTIGKVIEVIVKMTGRNLELASAVAGKVLPVLIRFQGFMSSNVVSAIVAVIGVVVKIIAKVFEFGGAVIDGGRKVAQFVGVVRDKIGEALAVIRSLPSKAAAALGGLAGTLYAKGAELIQGLINGIASKIQAVKDKIAEVAGVVKRFLPGSPVKEGPLRSWNNGGAGKRLMGMLAEGIEAGRKPLNAVMEKVSADLKAKVDELKALKDAAAAFADTIRDKFRTADFTQGGLSDLLAGLKSDITAASKFTEAVAIAQMRGLSGGLLTAVAGSGNLQLAADLAASSSAQIEAAEAAYRLRQQTTRGNARTLTADLYEVKADALRAEVQGLRAEVRKLAKQIGQETAGALNDAAARGARRRAAA